MTKRRVPKIVREANRLDEIAVDVKVIPQGAIDGAQIVANRSADLRDLHRMRQPRAVEIVLARKKHLRLRLKLPKRMRMDDAIAIDLERIAVVRLARAAKRLAVKRLIETVRHSAECSGTGSESESESERFG